MDMIFKKTQHGAVPVGDASVSTYNRIGLDDEFMVKYAPRRNSKFHRKFFKLVESVFINLPHGSELKTKEMMREYITYKAGYYSTIFVNGVTIHKIDSIAFDKMDNAQFAEFWDSALDVCFAEISEDAVNEIIKFM